MSLCIAAAGLAVEITVLSFTLAWTHTVEKTEWQEDWRIEGDRLLLAEARIQASGAGMEPPAGVRLVDGFYAWRPHVPPLSEIVLRRAAEADDWRLCAGDRCATVAEWLGDDADPVRLSVTPKRGRCEELGQK
jgi:hypothetical protein